VACIRLVDDVVVLERRDVRELESSGELADVLLVPGIAIAERRPEEGQRHPETLAARSQEVLREHRDEREIGRDDLEEEALGLQELPLDVLKRWRTFETHMCA
jgi:hypothetical protein